MNAAEEELHTQKLQRLCDLWVSHIEADDHQVPNPQWFILRLDKQEKTEFASLLRELLEGMAYKGLEQQIRELWKSRGLEVIEERFVAVGKDKFKWTIIAKRIPLGQVARSP